MYALITVSLVLALAMHVFQVERRPVSKIPGPWYSKYTSLVLKYYWVQGWRSYYVHDLHQKYGRAVRIAPDEVNFYDVTALKQIFNVKNVFPKSIWYELLTGSTDDNVFRTTKLEVHRRHRKLLSGAMSESSLKSAEPVVTGRVNLAIERIKAEMETRGAADVFKWWLFMATDVIGELSFGKSFQMLEQGKKNEYAEYLENTAVLSAIRSTFPSLAVIAGFLPLPTLRQAFESVRKRKQYAEESLARYERLSQTDPTRMQHGLFTRMFRAKDEETLEHHEIRSNAESYIVAGSDTTSNTLTYLVWSVCRHPEVKAALVEELGGLPDGFGDAELRQLPYLSQVIDESLRLFAAAPSGLPRKVPAGGAELGEGQWWVDAGTTVCAQAYSMHRDPDIYPEPEAFRPGRWAAPTKAMKDAFVPFGGGSRVCIGLHLARMELRYATARFFVEFPDARVSTREGMADGDMWPKIFFLLSPTGRRCLIEAGDGGGMAEDKAVDTSVRA